MTRVGQCEACEAWFLARTLHAARVVRPTLSARAARVEHLAGVPGYEPPPEVAYFCLECTAAIKEDTAESREVMRTGGPALASEIVGDC